MLKEAIIIEATNPNTEKITTSSSNIVVNQAIIKKALAHSMKETQVGIYKIKK